MFIWAGAVAWQVNLLPVTPASYVSAGLCPDCSTSKPTTADTPGKAVNDGPSIWATASTQRTWTKLLTVAICGVRISHS